MQPIMRAKRGGRVASVLGLLGGLAVLGCAPAAPPAPAPAGPVTAFDGPYTGSLRATGAASGMDPQNCAPDPRLAFEVRQGRFAFPVNHPRLTALAADLREKANVTYSATIAADGAVTGIAEATNTNLVGRVSGNRMSGEIFGLLCSYAFTADRG